MCIVAATVTLCALLPQLAWAEAAAGNATVRVDSAQALQNAIDEGINNVVITAHLDIRGLSPTRQGQAASNVKLLVQNTQFIQVQYLFLLFLPKVHTVVHVASTYKKN